MCEKHKSFSNDENMPKMPLSVGPKSKQRTTSTSNQNSPIYPKKVRATTGNKNSMKNTIIITCYTAAIEKIVLLLSKGSTVGPEAML